MCVYDGDDPRWLQEAMESILNQTCRPSEVVLVVDGPVRDALNAVITHYHETAGVRLIRFAVNRGHGDARRAGLEACTYPLVAIMDADDVSVPDRFEKQLSFFAEHPDVDVVGGNISEFIDSPEHPVGKRIVPEADAQIKAYLRYRCPMNFVTVMFRKAAVEEAGGFLDMYCEEDYYLWARMYLRNMTFANVPDILVNVRVGREMYSRRGGLRYFKSELAMQKYMLENGIIRGPAFALNVLKRFIVQVMLPDGLRGWVFQKFARS